MHEEANNAYISQDDQDLINSYKEYTFRLEKAKVSGDEDEIKKWTMYLRNVDDDLKRASISVEPF